MSRKPRIRKDGSKYYGPAPIKLPSLWGFKVAYQRGDGLRFEATVVGPDKGRCEVCLRVVTIDPPDEANSHGCQPR